MNLSKIALGAATASAASAPAAVVVFDIVPDSVSTPGYYWQGFAVASLNLSNGTFVPGSATMFGDVYRYGSPPSLFSMGTYGESLIFNGAIPRSDVKVARTITGGLKFFESGASIGGAEWWSDRESAISSTITGGSGIAYIGLRYEPDWDAPHYPGVYHGWIEVSFSQLIANTDPQVREFTLTRFAFESQSGLAITTPAAVPEASTLGLVGGLFGLVAAAHVRRRRQQQAAASDKFLALAAGEKLN